MSIFGNATQPSSGTSSNLFGQPASGTSTTSNLFGNTSTSTGATGTSSLFGNTAPASNAPAATGLFGGAPANNPAGSLFGTSTTSQPAPTGGLFSNATTASQPTGSLFGTSMNPSQPSGTLFGSATATSKPSLFSNTATAPPATGGGLFGTQTSQPAQSGGLFGTTNTTTGNNLFGSTNNASTNKPGGLFGTSFGATTNNVNQTNPNNQSVMQPAAPDLSQSMMDSRRIWNEEDGAPRSRTVLEQLQLVNKKWDPSSPQHAFQTYLYNQVPPDAQPFYRPAPGESEDAWEEALKKAPNAGAVPFRVRGFYELGLRIVSQRQHLDILSGRLHEINNGLTTLLRKHELDIASRTAAARRRHAALSQRVLTLTTKTMMARNRGYALDGAEEELRKKLVTLERGVMDPALSGREEEIWARMVSVREKGKLLEMELQRAGLNAVDGGQTQEISEEVLKQAKKILEDYDSQLSHLSKELTQIKTDWEDWESTKSKVVGR